MSDDLKSDLARHDERLKVVEREIKTLRNMAWGVVVSVLAFVGNKLLALLQMGV